MSRSPSLSQVRSESSCLDGDDSGPGLLSLADQTSSALRDDEKPELDNLKKAIETRNLPTQNFDHSLKEPYFDYSLKEPLLEHPNSDSGSRNYQVGITGPSPRVSNANRRCNPHRIWREIKKSRKTPLGCSIFSSLTVGAIVSLFELAGLAIDAPGERRFLEKTMGAVVRDNSAGQGAVLIIFIMLAVFMMVMLGHKVKSCLPKSVRQQPFVA